MLPTTGPLHALTRRPTQTHETAVPPAEPSPALRTFFDLPLRLDLPAELTARVETLEKQARALQPTDTWLPIYEGAIGLSEAAGAHLEEQLDAVRDQLLGLPDPNRLRQETVGRLRKEADDARASLKTDLQALVREWSDRAKRQQSQVGKECETPVSEHLVLVEAPVAGGVALSIEPGWWGEYRGFAHKCSTLWTEQVANGVEMDLQARMADLSALSFSEGKPVPTLVPPTPPKPEGLFETPPRTEQVELPSAMGALASFVRSNLMMVSMFSMMVVGGGVISRGTVLLGALPFIAVFGFFAGRRQRDRLKTKALEAARTKVLSEVQRDLKSGLDGCRSALERHIKARTKAYEAAADTWGKEVLAPAMEAAEAETNASIKRLRKQSGQLQEKQAGLKGQLTQVNKNLLFELRRRQRDLGRAE